MIQKLKLVHYSLSFEDKISLMIFIFIINILSILLIFFFGNHDKK